jgi:AcrR family transcriptional regulator
MPRKDEPETRARVIRAAVECILEEGFYRASSNRIAERAGLTWGVIQYYFGTRENLLLAVVQHSVDRLRDTLSGAEVTGDTTEQRLDSLADAVWAVYRRPEFLAYLQTALELVRDPKTADRAATSLYDVEEPLRKVWSDLMAQALPGADRALAATVFETLRGVAIGELLLHALPHRSAYLGVDRDVVVRALSMYVDTGAPHVRRRPSRPRRRR